MSREIQEQIEGTFEACQMDPDVVIREVRDAVSMRLEQLGFVVEYSADTPGRSGRRMVVFDIDRMISFPQVRNGLIRSQYNFMRHVENLNTVRCKIKILEKYSRLRSFAITSYETIHSIIHGQR